MMQILGEEPEPPCTEPHGVCPECGSHRILHHLHGAPDLRTAEQNPPWIVWQGCTPAFGDRSCEDCEAHWWVKDGQGSTPGRSKT